jgi:hypothetical protein
MLTTTLDRPRHGKLRAEDKIIPLATPWQTVGAYAGSRPTRGPH